MTTDSADTQWTVQALLDLFDAAPRGQDEFTAQTGPAGEDQRQVVEGTQVLAQSIVAAAKRFPEKSVRSVYSVFARAVMVGAGPVELGVDVVSEGRSTATAVVTASQNGKRCITTTVLADVPTDDVIRHHRPRPDVAPPEQANVASMPMAGRELRLVDVEHLYGGERVVAYYLADGRVDFRELVKLLAKEFQTRIEMRQIGVRDEAKLMADYGDCGKPVCCNTHLSEMPPVSMKMAKLQKATLDPTKISGRCGRLKCCLRYEYETYQELRKELPPVGADIITNQGRAKVLAQEILAGQVMVQTEDMRRIVVAAEDVLTVLSKGGKPRAEKRYSDKETPDASDAAETQTAVLDMPEQSNGAETEAENTAEPDSKPDGSRDGDSSQPEN